MLKKLIAPLQKILLQKGICPGCTMLLSKSENKKAKNKKEDIIVCKCGRIFIYDKELDSYRRALEKEVI